MNKIITDITEQPDSIETGSLWKDNDEGDTYLLAKLYYDGTYKYAAINLATGNRWRDAHADVSYAVESLTLIAKEATITVSSLVK